MRKEEDWTWLLENKDGVVTSVDSGDGGSTRQKQLCTAGGKECGPHGSCQSGKCLCTASFTGIYMLLRFKHKFYSLMKSLLLRLNVNRY